ncbi:MAG: DinB family protein [Vicinamibacterales bacterium]
MTYTTLSRAEVQAALEAVAREVEAAFGALDARRLNWRPSEAQWSVAQCLEHLLHANRLMRDAADAALAPGRTQTLWERMPVVPGLFGRLLITSQAPGGARKFKTTPQATPAASAIDGDVVRRLVDHHRQLAAWVAGADEPRAARTVMTSPFAGFVIYTVLDGWRLMVSHDHRHVEQARRVMALPAFPAA